MKKYKQYARRRKDDVVDMIFKLEKRDITEKDLEKALVSYLINISKETSEIIREGTYECVEGLFDGMEVDELKEYAVQQLNTLIIMYDGILVSQIDDIKKVDMKQFADLEYECTHDAKYYLIEILRRIRNGQEKKDINKAG